MKITRPRSVKNTMSILRMCNEENTIMNLTIIKNFFTDKNFTVKVKKNKNNYFFYVFYKDVGCICYCEFINSNYLKSIFKLKQYKQLFTPHCDVNPSYRRFGIVSAIYRYFLLNVSEAVLMTDKHTKAAKGLWEYVAKEINGNINYFNIVNGKLESKPTNSNIKLLSKS